MSGARTVSERWAHFKRTVSKRREHGEWTLDGINSNESIYNEFIHLLLVSAVSEYLTYFKQNDILTVLNKFNKFIK